MSPYRDTRPYVGLSPTTPQKCAGCRMLPPVSEPREALHWRAATAAAEPPEEPPGTRLVSHGLRVGCEIDRTSDDSQRPWTCAHSSLPAKAVSVSCIECNIPRKFCTRKQAMLFRNVCKDRSQRCLGSCQASPGGSHIDMQQPQTAYSSR